MMLFAIIDLPQSLVADTLFIPLTAYQQSRYGGLCHLDDPPSHTSGCPLTRPTPEPAARPDRPPGKRLQPTPASPGASELLAYRQRATDPPESRAAVADAD